MNEFNYRVLDTDNTIVNFIINTETKELISIELKKEDEFKIVTRRSEDAMWLFFQELSDKEYIKNFNFYELNDVLCSSDLSKMKEILNDKELVLKKRKIK